MKRALLSFFLGSLTFAAVAYADVCANWFSKSAIKSGDKNCLSKCAALRTGMDTFVCVQACPRLCHTNLPRELIMDFAYYPGLNKVERALIAEYPKEALVVYRLMNATEAHTLKHFKRSAQDDESDAFRHFVWAGLLVKELGVDTAQKFLDGHEAEPMNGTDERAMDLANNRAGILEAQRLKKAGKLTERDILEKALEALRENKLVVRKARGGIP